MSPLFVDNEKLDWTKIAYHGRSVFAVVLSLVILVGGGLFVYSKVSEVWHDWRTAEDYIGEGTEEVEVVIPKGASITQIGDLLTEAGVIRSTKAFRNAASNNSDSEGLQAGRYKLKKELPAETALKMMLDPKSLVENKITLKEGLTMSQQLAVIKKELGASEEALQEALKANDLGLPKWAGGKPEGFLFPETYALGEPFDPVALFKSQIAQFNKVAKELELEGKAKTLGVEPYEIVIVASLIEREASKAEDRPKVAAVVYNRLKADMELKFDSTVHYAIGDFSKVTTTDEERATDSPYNTYKYKGLPPGPTSNPGKAALEAALNPADIDALFFTTINLDTGETVFANTGEEHNENVAKFQKWCQDHPGRCE